MAAPALKRLHNYVTETQKRLMGKIPYETILYDDDYEPYVDSPPSPSSPSGNFKDRSTLLNDRPRLRGRGFRRSRLPKLSVLLALLVTSLLIAVLLAANLRSSSVRELSTASEVLDS